MTAAEIRSKVGSYYAGRLKEHGPSPRGVDWNSEESQTLRFRQLARVLPSPGQPFTVLDYGCGYGALVGFLDEVGLDYDYLGFDIAPSMVDEARRNHGGARRRFTTDEAELESADYALASGVFNVRLDTDLAVWSDYVVDTLNALDRLGRRGLAFNMLTSYSDPERMRPDLFYADPCRYFDHCKQHFSKQVALLHDYGLYEFTILVRK